MFNKFHLFLISFISLILFTPAQSNTYPTQREGYDYMYQANLFSNTQGEYSSCNAMKPKPSVGQSFGPCQRTQDASIFAYQYSIKWDNKDTVSWSSPIIGKCDTKQGWVRVTVGGKAACERPKNVCYSPMTKAEDGTCKCPTSGGSFGSTGCDKGCSVSLNMDLTNLTHSFEYSGGKCTVGDDNGGDDSDTDTPPTDSAGNPVSNYTPSPGKSCASGYGEMKMGDKRKCVKEGDAPSTSACPLGQMMYKGSCKTFTDIMNDGDTGGDTGGTGGDNGGGTGGGTGGDTGGGTGGDNGGGTGGDTGNCPEGQKCDDEGGGGPISGGSLPAQSKLYTQKYPGGIVGVWKNTAPTIANTKFGQGLSNMFPTFGTGSCPNWSVDLNFGSGMNFGSFGFDIPCWVFQACGLIILATAAFTARKIIF